VGRTILLNFVLGAFFGWVYWRQSLELAMLAHAATHVVFWIVTPLLVAPLI
jgi:membrane protease YdiL (CAAX protease family)